MMSSWVQLLLVVLAACLRFGVAAGDPLPAALVELVRNSPISSIEDLQMLLLSDSVDEEDGTSAANGGHRLPRSLEAQPAQQALCKVRTEVVEVTRAMLDRSNANFLLWPPCVEVQRCSGCCNTKSLQCVPFVTHTRYLQVMKIEFINQKAIYGKAVVSVVDHVECRCQPAPRMTTPRKKSSRRQHGHHNHRNQTNSPDHGHTQAKVQSKDELHQWDELKRNQRAHLEDLLEQQWSSRGDTFNQPEGGYSLPGQDKSQPGEAFLYTTHWRNGSGGVQGTESEGRENVGRQDENPSHDNTTVSVVDNVVDTPKNKLVEGENGSLMNDTERNQEKSSADTRGNKSELTQNHSSDHSRPVTQNPEVKHGPTEENLHHRVGSRFRPTKEPNPDPPGQGRRRQNETPREEWVTQREEDKQEEKRKELLLLHKSLDQEKEIVRQQQMKREEEERQREKETEGRHLVHGKLHHQLTTQTPVTSTSTTMSTTTTTTTTTRRPAAPTGPRPPAHSNHGRRRVRKNRKRISKAAMRAMLM